MYRRDFLTQEDLNVYLITENIRLQAQVDFLMWLAIDHSGARFDRKSLIITVDPTERGGGMQEFLIEARKKFEIPLIEACSLLDANQKEQLIGELNKMKYVPPKPKKWVEGHYE